MPETDYIGDSSGFGMLGEEAKLQRYCIKYAFELPN